MLILSQVDAAPVAEKFLVKIGAFIFFAALSAVAAWLYRTFPSRRKAICRALIVAGFLMALPFLISQWTGNLDFMSSGMTAVLFILLVLGFVLIIVGWVMLLKMNREGGMFENDI